jgi:hypothetical protein
MTIDLEKMLRYIISEAEKKKTRKEVLKVLYQAYEVVESHDKDRLEEEFGVLG